MPEFNFAKGAARAPKDRKSAEAPRTSETGSTKPVSAARLDDELPYELNEPPRREQQPPVTHAVVPPAVTTGAATPSGSVLDKYPKRDFSHLASATAQPGSTRAEASQPVSDPQPAYAAEPEEHPESESAINEEEHAMPSASNDHTSRSGGRLPLIVIGSVVLLLVLLAFVWHLNPYPPLREAIAGFFNMKSADKTVSPATSQAERDDAAKEAPVLRSWDYYLQVSSWKELVKADQEAERFRSQGLDVAVESEPIPSRGGTYYRVRLGPYESAEAAYAAAAVSPGIVPPDAFLDSVRLSEDLPVEAKTTTRPARERSRAKGEDMTGTDELTRWRKDFGIVDEPLSGYAVQVSSLRSVDVARIEARKMVEQGYPAFITRASIGSSTWYRVLVGPFNSRADADKYSRLINTTFGNEAYTIDLSLK